MATSITTAQQTAISKLYVAFFNRAADSEGLGYWAGKLAEGVSLNDIAQSMYSTTPARAYYSTALTNEQFVKAFYATVLNRPNPDAEGVAFWTSLLNQPGQTQGSVANSIISAVGTYAGTLPDAVAAKTMFDARVQVSTAYALQGGNVAGASTALSGVVDAATAAAAIANQGATIGSTFTLTTGADTGALFTGTAGNDTFNADASLVLNGTNGTMVTTDTMQNVDVLKGGAGIDTLNFTTAGTVALPTLESIEIINASSLAGLTIDTSAVTGVTNLNVIKAVGTVAATAAATTDISVSVKENGVSSVLAHTVDGGKNVTVTVTDAGSIQTTAPASAADTIVIGNLIAAKGDVVVTATGKVYDAATAALNLGAITVTGGKTVSVTQKAASDVAAAAADKSNIAVTQGAVTVNANADTTTITLKQDAAVSAKNAADSTGGVTETSSVKFGALKATDSLTVNGLTFSAKVDMTAAEVASAFSNLVDGKLPVAGDTQSSGLATKGTYTNAFTTNATSAAGWTSAAANGDTVVFTAARVNVDATDLTFTGVSVVGSVAPVQTKVQGKAHDATPAGGVMGVAAGQVTIAGTTATAVKTITVDGYSATGSSITSTTSALETLSLSNGGAFAVAAAAETLALNLKSVGTAAKLETLTSSSAVEARATLDLNNSVTKTLNINSDGANTVSLDLAGATGTTALNVSGSGLLDAKTSSNLGSVTTIKVTETAGLDLGATATTNVASVNTTATTGAVTIAIDGGKATYTGGAGTDSVTISAVTGTFTKAINLGAGNDKLDLKALSATQLKAITTANLLEGGDGTDTVVLTAAAAVELSANATFAGKINGFEKLSLDKATAAGTVNLANLDNINYVISANSSSVTAAATAATFAVDMASADVNADDVMAFNGGSLTVIGTPTAGALALQLAGLSYTNWNVKSVAGTVITFEAKIAGTGTTVPTTVFVLTDDNVTASTYTQSITSSTVGAAAGTAATALTIDKMASGGTLELTDSGAGAIVNVTDALTGTADVLNVVANASGNLGTVKAADVETFNLSVTNKTISFDTVYGDVKVADAASVSTLALDGNAATTVNVSGAGSLSLSIAAATKVAVVDASTATGVLTLDLAAHNGVAVTVTGGQGNDVLTASAGTNAKADVLIGGAGNDTLYAGSNGAKLTGGAGDDLFVLAAGSKEANTYSSILDFKAGDMLKLNVTAGTAVTSFSHLTATLNESTSVFSNFIDAAIQQATTGQSVWFQYKGDAYVVVDNVEIGTGTADTFQNGVDAVIQLVGTDLANASYNSTNGTIALV